MLTFSNRSIRSTVALVAVLASAPAAASRTELKCVGSPRILTIANVVPAAVQTDDPLPAPTESPMPPRPDLATVAARAGTLGRMTQGERADFCADAMAALAAVELRVTEADELDARRILAVSAADRDAALVLGCMAILSEVPASRTFLLEAIHGWRGDPASAAAAIRAVSDTPDPELGAATEAILAEGTAYAPLKSACKGYRSLARRIEIFTAAVREDERVFLLIQAFQHPIQVEPGKAPLGTSPTIRWARRESEGFAPAVLAQALYELDLPIGRLFPELTETERAEGRVAVQACIARYLNAPTEEAWRSLVSADATLAPYLPVER